MAFFRRLWRILAGDRDQTEIAVTRTADGVRFRLPNRGHDREFWTPWLIGTLLLGPILLVTIINVAANMPPEDHNILGTIVCLLGMISAMAGVTLENQSTLGRPMLFRSLLMMPKSRLNISRNTAE